ncbi:MAG: D-alanyl-D-alanine carboxypeptidase/D-alanyl-D-alanine-endopeptidase [Bacteroidales bacterium]
MPKKNCIILALIILTGIYQLHSQEPSNLHKQLAAFAAHASLKNASWSLHVAEATTGQPILSHNSDLALVPASTQKVVTTATALLLLGDDYRYATTLSTHGMVSQEGLLEGDLVIKGSGDPTLGAAQMADSLSLEQVFNRWLSDLKAAGVRKIAGSIIADDSAFDREMVPRKWLWEDMGNYYGAGASGLTVHENMYTVYFDGGSRPGEPVKVLGTEPAIPGMILENQLRTGEPGSGDQVYILGAPYSPLRILTGTVPAGARRFAVKGSIPDPAAYLANAFNQFLQLNGMITSGNTLSWQQARAAGNASLDSRQVISTWWSPPLKDIVKYTNIESNNTYAENLLKTIGLHNNGQGTTKEALKGLDQFWTQKGLDTSGMTLHDGSGLSPSNRLTTRQLTHLLAFCTGQPIYESFRQSLPVAGETGSLTNLFKNTASQGVLIAKSGYLNNVRAYAGYTTLQDGTLVAFAFILNNYQGSSSLMRSRMVHLMDAITTHIHSEL